MPALKPCLDCDTLSEQARCPTHRRAKATATLRGKRARRPHTAAEDRRRARAVADHRARHGDWCPGWPGGPHPERHRVIPPNILTADHLEPVGAGGGESGPLIVRCRSCNSARGLRT